MNSRLVSEFEKAADFMVAQCRGGTFKKPSSNFLREYVRCASGLKFSNTVSPTVLRALLHKRPDLAPYIELGTLK